jgi:DUF3040 family protein
MVFRFSSTRREAAAIQRDLDEDPTLAALSDLFPEPARRPPSTRWAGVVPFLVAGVLALLGGALAAALLGPLPLGVACAVLAGGCALAALATGTAARPELNVRIR